MFFLNMLNNHGKLCACIIKCTMLYHFTPIGWTMTVKSVHEICVYTVRDAPDSMEVADFIGLMKIVNKLQQAC